MAFVVGCYGDITSGVSAASPGNCVAYSLPNFPEAFPPENLFALPGPPVGVLEVATDGYVYIVGRNYLAVVSAGGGTPTVQILWPNIGVQNISQLCVVDGKLYAMTGNGLVRTGPLGEPESDWAIDVREDLKGLTAANTVLGYDANSKTFCVANGSQIWPYHVPSNAWGAPCDISTLPTPISGTITSSATVDGSLKFTVKNGATFTLYTWNVGSGSVWEAYSRWCDAKEPMYDKTLMCLRSSVRHDNLASPTFTTRVYKKKLASPILAKTITETITVASEQHLLVDRMNVRNAKSFQVYQSARSGSAGESSPLETIIEGTSSAIRI
jgi:hypothetical protein